MTSGTGRTTRPIFLLSVGLRRVCFTGKRWLKVCLAMTCLDRQCCEELHGGAGRGARPPVTGFHQFYCSLSSKISHCRRRVHWSQWQLVYSHKIWGICREGFLQEVEAKHPLPKCPIGRTHSGKVLVMRPKHVGYKTEYVNLYIQLFHKHFSFSHWGKQVVKSCLLFKVCLVVIPTYFHCVRHHGFTIAPTTLFRVNMKVL